MTESFDEKREFVFKERFRTAERVCGTEYNDVFLCAVTFAHGRSPGWISRLPVSRDLQTSLHQDRFGS